jgi:hypothetical protein
VGPNSQHHQPSRQLLSCRAEVFTQRFLLHVQTLEVVINYSHATNKLTIGKVAARPAAVACQWGMAGCPCA